MAAKREDVVGFEKSSLPHGLRRMEAGKRGWHIVHRLLLAVATFFSVLGAADGLRCYQCVGMFHECVQTEQLCTNRDRSCFSSTIKLFYSNSYNGVFMLPDLEIAEYVMKGCSGEGVSNRTANVYSDDDREVHNTYYCDTDLCNIRFTGAPASSHQVPNGMECYSCFDRGTGECAPGNATRIKCVGDMNQCMDFTVIDGAWKMTYRTCALETLCRRQYVLPDLSGRLEISCCSTPLCNDGRPGVKSICSHFSEQGIKRKSENGLECASCCDTGLGECAPGNWTHVKCLGDQNMCVNMTGDAIFCFNCTSTEGYNCSTTQEKCSSSVNSCITIARDEDTGDLDIENPVYEKKCNVDDRLCNQFYGLMAGDFRMRWNSSCCRADRCNTNEIIVQKASQNPNGMLCNSCFARGTDMCLNKIVVACTGLLTHCIHFATIAKKDESRHEQVAFTGCATRNMCDMGAVALFARSPNVTVKTILCNGALAIPSQGVLALLMLAGSLFFVLES